MLGYDVSWAAFNIVEVMSSSKFTYKVRASKKNLYTRKCSSLMYLSLFAVFPAEDWLSGCFTVFPWKHWCHHVDYQSNTKGQLFSGQGNYLKPFGCCLFFSFTDCNFVVCLYFVGSQQPEPVRHRCCPHWSLLFCDPWPCPGLGQWHYDTGESQCGGCKD